MTFVVTATVALVGGCASNNNNTSTASTTSSATASPSVSTTPTAPTLAAGPDCAEPVAGPSVVATAFPDPREFKAEPICLADVGPGLAPEVTAQFGDVAAVEVTQADVWIGQQHGLLVLRAFVGTLKSGSGEAFVDSYLSGVGPDARHGTVQLVGHVVQYFIAPDGRQGYAFADGPTVVIGYVVPLDEASSESVDMPAQEAYTRILAAATGAPIADDKPPSFAYPLASGRYTTDGDAGWVFFKTDGGSGCGIGPDGVAGCDMVPADAPEGTNQTIVDKSGPARYIHSDTPTFTRDVDILPPGRRLENAGVTCSAGFQGTVGCDIGEHGFTIAGHYGVLR